MAESLDHIEAEIKKDKAAFNAARMRLAMLLGPSMPKPGAEDIIIGHDVDDQLEHTLQKCAKDPAFFDLGAPIDKGLAAKITEPLREAILLNQKLVDLVAARTKLMMEKDNAYKPVYFWMGDEFTIDPKMETYTISSTGQTFAFIRDDEKPRSPPSPSKGMSR